MKQNVFMLFFASLVFSSWAVAETGEQTEQFKQKLIAHVDSEIAILTQFKNCIQAAKNRPDFETCNKVKNEAQKKKIVEMKKEQLESRKKQLALEEKQLNEMTKSESK